MNQPTIPLNLPYPELGQKIGELVAVKSEAYGDSVGKCGDYLRLLYPSGIKPEQYGDALLLARDFDKNMRIANDKNAFGENPYIDKAGYALRGVRLTETDSTGTR